MQRASFAAAPNTSLIPFAAVNFRSILRSMGQRVTSVRACYRYAFCARSDP